MITVSFVGSLGRVCMLCSIAVIIRCELQYRISFFTAPKHSFQRKILIREQTNLHTNLFNVTGHFWLFQFIFIGFTYVLYCMCLNKIEKNV